MERSNPKEFVGLRHLLVKYAEMAKIQQNEELSRTFASFYTALSIIGHWMGKEWVLRNFWSDKAHPQLRLIPGAGAPTAELRALRMRKMAEDLFNLQYVEGFQAMLTRMKSNNIEALLAELRVGRLLYVHDVDFRFVEPTCDAGSDYDIEIRVPGFTICGETKCKISTTKLNPKSLANTLRKAATKQLPKDRPGVIFLAFPPQWFEGANPLAAERETLAAAEQALRNISRLVSVVLYTSPLEHDGTYAFEGDFFSEVQNPTHKFGRSPHFKLLNYRQSEKYWDGMPPKWLRLYDLPFGALGEYRHEEE